MVGDELLKGISGASHEVLYAEEELLHIIHIRGLEKILVGLVLAHDELEVGVHLGLLDRLGQRHLNTLGECLRCSHHAGPVLLAELEELHRPIEARIGVETTREPLDAEEVVARDRLDREQEVFDPLPVDLSKEPLEPPVRVRLELLIDRGKKHASPAEYLRDLPMTRIQQHLGVL